MKNAGFLTRVALAIIFIPLLSNGRMFDYDVSISTTKSMAVTSDKFVSVTLDTGTIVRHWEGFDPNAPLAITLARALYPAFLRVGGTSADSLIFVGGGHVGDTPVPNSTFTKSDWDMLNTFTETTNLTLIYGLNSLYRPGADWDPTNVIELLKYTIQKGYTLNFELGNEPNIYPSKYNRSIDPQQLGRDFGRLRSLLNSMPPFQYSALVGPDVTSDVDISGITFLENFMKTGSGYIDAMTFHHYYMNGHTAGPKDFIDPKRLDSFKADVIAGQQIIANFSTGTKDFWLGETSSAYGGGVRGVSDTYIAGFMWLDKLGLCARYGAKVVMRQELVGGNYGLIEYHDGVYTPNPDYWLTLVYKAVVGRIVLDTQGSDDRLRIYSHCTNQRSGYGPGSVTFYMMNLYNTTKTVSFSQFPGKEFHIYLLSSGNTGTLMSKLSWSSSWLLILTIEGMIKTPLDISEYSIKQQATSDYIKCVHGGALPPMPPVTQSSPIVNVAPFTMEFVVVPQAKAAICM